MFIFQVHHYIKTEFIEAYKAATLENARKTILESGVIQFDVLLDLEDPAHFSLFEIYLDDEARSAHLETEHFLTWKDTVLGNEMFVKKGYGNRFDPLFMGE